MILPTPRRLVDPPPPIALDKRGSPKKQDSRVSIHTAVAPLTARRASRGCSLLSAFILASTPCAQLARARANYALELSSSGAAGGLGDDASKTHASSEPLQPGEFQIQKYRSPRTFFALSLLSPRGSFNLTERADLRGSNRAVRISRAALIFSTADEAAARGVVLRGSLILVPDTAMAPASALSPARSRRLRIRRAEMREYTCAEGFCIFIGLWVLLMRWGEDVGRGSGDAYAMGRDRNLDEVRI